MRYTFQTWGEFLDFADKRKLVCGYEPSRSQTHSFTKTHSFRDALTLARNGWPEGEEKIRPLANALFTKVGSLVEREEMVHDVVGNALDIGAYLNNDPECWMHPETHLEEGFSPRILRLVFNAAVSAGVSTDVIQAKGAAIAALIQALELSAYRVEVWVIAWCCSRTPEDRHSVVHENRVLVKSADQNLDFGRLVFALAHPSMPRRLGFAVTETDPRSNEKWGLCMGYPCETRTERGDIYIGCSFLGEPHWTNAESVIAWILETLKAQGVAIREE